MTQPSAFTRVFKLQAQLINTRTKKVQDELVVWAKQPEVVMYVLNQYTQNGLEWVRTNAPAPDTHVLG